MAVIQDLINSPYGRLMRLHQPVGIGLLLWPCWWAVTLSSGGKPDITVLAAFAVGAVSMRAAGCIINDIWDRDIDAQVERTRTRPLASGEITVAQALALLGVLLSIGFGVAWVLGLQVVLWAAASLPLIILYPLCKRITWWPQAVLGLTFNWGALLGVVAVKGMPDISAWLLYAAGFFWTLGYDTIYAHQDKRDDEKLGVKSTARYLGDATKPWVAVFYTATLVCLGSAGVHPVGLLLVAAHFTWQIYRIDLDNPASCGRIFRSNVWTGALTCLGCFLSSIR